MKTSFLPAAWRKTLQLPVPVSAPANRGRRPLRLDQLLSGECGARRAHGDRDGEQFDGSWHESSQALARGLLVQEWGSAEMAQEGLALR